MSYTPMIFFDCKEYDKVKAIMEENNFEAYVYNLSVFPISFISRSEFSTESLNIRNALDKANIRYEEVN